MIRGLYTAATGIVLGVARQALIAHDVANSTTAGYKQAALPLVPSSRLDAQRLSTGSAEPVTNEIRVATGPLGTGVWSEPIVIDFEQGSLRATGRVLDVALEGEGFFQIRDARGTFYTRDGSFHRDAAGNLVTATGQYVLGDNNAPIQLPEGEPVIGPDGTITVNGQGAGRLGIVQFAQPNVLQRAGGNMFTANVAGAPAQARVRQGYLEMSNVDPNRTVVEMLRVARSYEASVRLVTVQDETIARLLDVGRVG